MIDHSSQRARSRPSSAPATSACARSPPASPSSFLLEPAARARRRRRQPARRSARPAVRHLQHVGHRRSDQRERARAPTTTRTIVHPHATRRWRRRRDARRAAVHGRGAVGARCPRRRSTARRFWHIMTNTPVHPKEPDVLELMGATQPDEMFPSFLAKQLAPCLGTHPAAADQRRRDNADRRPHLRRRRRSPIIPPLALKATLANPTGPARRNAAAAARPDAERSSTISTRTARARRSRQYIDSLVTSQQQVRSIKPEPARCSCRRSRTTRQLADHGRHHAHPDEGDAGRRHPHPVRRRQPPRHRPRRPRRRRRSPASRRIASLMHAAREPRACGPGVASCRSTCSAGRSGPATPTGGSTTRTTRCRSPSASRSAAASSAASAPVADRLRRARRSTRRPARAAERRHPAVDTLASWAMTMLSRSGSIRRS